MEYRIRYQKAEKSRESEFVVEANSPMEALVKFRHTCDAEDAGGRCETVVSICQTECPEPLTHAG